MSVTLQQIFDLSDEELVETVIDAEFRASENRDMNILMVINSYRHQMSPEDLKILNKFRGGKHKTIPKIKEEVDLNTIIGDSFYAIIDPNDEQVEPENILKVIGFQHINYNFVGLEGYTFNDKNLYGLVSQFDQINIVYLFLRTTLEYYHTYLENLPLIYKGIEDAISKKIISLEINTKLSEIFERKKINIVKHIELYEAIILLWLLIVNKDIKTKKFIIAADKLLKDPSETNFDILKILNLPMTITSETYLNKLNKKFTI